MNDKLSSIPLKKVEINDKFWNKYIGLVKEVLIPYQWSILNDLIDDAEPSRKTDIWILILLSGNRA